MPSGIVGLITESTNPKSIYFAPTITLNDIKSQSAPDNTLTFLADLSKRDAKWDSHRRKTTQVERIYQASELHENYAERMKLCSTFLDFRLVPSEDELKLKLSRAMFCHVRFCPVCQWKGSERWHAKALTIIPKVLEAYPTYRWLFLTLTLTHIPVSDLREEIKHLNKSFERLSKLKDFPGEGWLKCVEVTHSKTTKGYAHPHLHILMIVKPIYFSANYLTVEKWRLMWAKSARIDYHCQLHITTFKKTDRSVDEVANLTRMLCETIKYQVKESDLTRDPAWTLEITDQLKGTRSISTAGILKAYMKELENEPEDLIGNDGEDDETVGHIYALWRRDCQRYVIKD